MRTIKKLSKISLIAVFALALVLGTGAGAAQATLTFGTTSVTGSTTLELLGAAGSAITIGAAAQVGTVSVGTSSAGMTLNLGTGNGAKTVAIATGTGIDTINIGTGGTAADDINIGDALADVDITGASSLVAGTGDALTLTGNAASTWSTTAGDLTLSAAAASVNVDANEAAADQIKLSAAGTIAGNAININTTDGGIVLTAAGAANGDITLAPADDFSLTATDDIAINSGSTSGIINIGTSAFAQTLNLATNAIGNAINIGTNNTVADTIIIGSALDDVDLAGEDIALTSADDIAINSGSTAGIINIGTSAFAQVVNIGVNELGNTVNIGTGATVANSVNIGTGAIDGNAVTIGNVTGASVVRLYGGTAGILLSSNNATGGVTANGAFNYGGTSGGIAQAQTITLTPAISALRTGLMVVFKAGAANTGAAPTLAVNGLAATAIVKGADTALVAGDIALNGVYTAVYDGTNFHLINPTAL